MLLRTFAHIYLWGHIFSFLLGRFQREELPDRSLCSCPSSLSVRVPKARTRHAASKAETRTAQVDTVWQTVYYAEFRGFSMDEQEVIYLSCGQDCLFKESSDWTWCYMMEPVADSGAQLSGITRRFSPMNSLNIYYYLHYCLYYYYCHHHGDQL